MNQPNTAAPDNQPSDALGPGATLVIVAETRDLRVVRITLETGGCIPWHHHSHVDDRFFCTEGKMTVETREPPEVHGLIPGAECTVPARTAHLVSNVGAGRCRFVLVQGMGAYDRVPEDAPGPTAAP